MEIQNKLKAVANVIDMLSGIIGEDVIEEEEEEQIKEATLTSQQTPSSSEKPSQKQVHKLCHIYVFYATNLVLEILKLQLNGFFNTEQQKYLFLI